MTAEIITLPVIRAMNLPAPDSDVTITIQIQIQPAIMLKLCAAAATAESTVESMAEALIVWSLAAIEHKSAEEFYISLDL